MNPVIGLDISKGESQVQAFVDKGKPFRKSFKVAHTLQGLDLLVEFLEVVPFLSNTFRNEIYIITIYWKW